MFIRGSLVNTDHFRLPTWDEESRQRFDQFTNSLRTVFARADQFARFRAYLHGLLEPIERKNIEAIAKVAGFRIDERTNPAQALHHFVSHSPWDYRRLLSMVRPRSIRDRSDSNPVWLVHDVTFAKKGNHSVGAIRQFSRDQGRKMNCQIGVMISQVTEESVSPLTIQLYLPSSWLKGEEPRDQNGVPDEFRTFASKAELALRLIDGLIQEGQSVFPIALDTSYQNDSALRDGLLSRSQTIQEDVNDVMEGVHESIAWMKSDLGLDHFEGRTWRGWHNHVSLVIAAQNFARLNSAMTKC